MHSSGLLRNYPGLAAYFIRSILVMQCIFVKTEMSFLNTLSWVYFYAVNKQYLRDHCYSFHLQMRLDQSE